MKSGKRITKCSIRVLLLGRCAIRAALLICKAITPAWRCRQAAVAHVPVLCTSRSLVSSRRVSYVPFLLPMLVRRPITSVPVSFDRYAHLYSSSSHTALFAAARYARHCDYLQILRSVDSVTTKGEVSRVRDARGREVERERERPTTRRHVRLNLVRRRRRKKDGACIFTDTSAANVCRTTIVLTRDSRRRRRRARRRREKQIRKVKAASRNLAHESLD